MNAAELPGFGYEFRNVTSIFTDAADDMGPTDMYFMEGFGLYEAMSALEIGEPRLDTGLIRDGEQLASLDPLTPMLPEEICWILDRACACEMEWHAGSLLSHTVFTLIYVHELPNFESDLHQIASSKLQDPSRPLELITVVLRSAVQGLLKCCDLSWRELSAGGMLDTEDWQSDKCEVSLLEGVPTKAVLSMLDEAANWILRSTKVSEVWRQPLRARIVLRKILLQLMEPQLCRDSVHHVKLIQEARQWLAYIRLHAAPEPKPESPAHQAFDTMIVRRLSTVIPASVVTKPQLEQAWNSLAALLDDLDDLSRLASTPSFTTWEAMANLRVWSSSSRKHMPYVRSLIQTTFYNGVLILHNFSFKWLLDRFMLESLGVSYEYILKNIAQCSRRSSEPPPVQSVERTFFTLLNPHIRNQWSNGPRRRRYFMKSLINWHRLYDILLDIIGGLELSSMSRPNALSCLPTVALRWRLSTIREVIFSGFQLELYSPEETPFAYWYATQVIEAELECLDELRHIVPSSSLTRHEYEYQRDFLTAVQLLAAVSFAATLPMMSCEWDRMRPNHYRRYKWAFRPEYDGIKTIPVASPNLYEFIHACIKLVQNEAPEVILRDTVRLANTILRELLDSGSLGGWAGSWTRDRVRFLQQTLIVGETLVDLPRSSKELETFNVGQLKWNPVAHPWFPSLVYEGHETRKRAYLRHLSV
ncbi:hypothetical protein AX17_001876 [Amanita inopinata Kibby_2008]|nr:hypothetical protein AX17_001876 [Amanita inopinata Kibby_2008]